MKVGYTQIVVSQKIGLTEAGYNRIETGRSVPRLQTMQAICNTLRLNWDETKSIYLRSIAYTPQLLELAAWSFRSGDIQFGKRVLAKVFAAAKRTGQHHLFAIGLFQILYWDPGSRCERLAQAVVEHMRKIGRRRTADMVEKVMLGEYN